MRTASQPGTSLYAILAASTVIIAKGKERENSIIADIAADIVIFADTVNPIVRL
jgi:hypothetical protein